MGRIIICGLLLCLAALTAYLYFERSEEESMPVVTREAPEVRSSEPPVSSAPRDDRETLSVRREPEKVETPDPAGVEKGAVDSPERERASERDREFASRAAEKFRTGDYEGAIKLYSELSGRDKSALAGMGISYLRLGDHENAERFLEQAVKNNPGDFGVRKTLAFFYYRKDDVDKGLSHAEAGLAIKRDPELQKICDKLRNDKNTREVSESESTSHFTITFDGYKHGGISRKVLEILEDAYSAVGKEFNVFPSGAVNTILYTNRDFYDITRAPGWSGGIYDGKIRMPVRGAEQNEATLKKVLFHEYTHSVVRSLTSRCPLWINEGLAEYFSISRAEKIGQVIPLDLLRDSFSWLRGEQVTLAYRESHSAVAYLIGKHGFHRMKEFLQTLSAGGDLEQAFKGSFGVSYSEFVSTWGKG
jgi:tetratricopeptide (TPR) repeat protein